MSQSRTLEELQDLNLSYLLLVQKLILEDRETAIFRLKIEADLADLLANLTLREMTLLARQQQSVLRPQLASAQQLRAVFENKRDTGLQETHLAMLMATA
ncbi:MAG TPA: flagellar transcriptional regulator FlhD [Pseudidiomarina sp.]|nr:flagellar transcriptional regulator FlhD [Pseudidiomarina sp.]